MKLDSAGFVRIARHAGRATFLVFLLCILSGHASCQTLVVQFMNGKSGKPIPKIRVYIGFDDLKTRQSLDLTTNRQGEVQFDANGSKAFQVHPVGLVACGEQTKGLRIVIIRLTRL